MRISDWSSDVCSSDLYDQQQVVQMRREIVEAQDTTAFHRAPVADGEQPRQPPPAEARRGIGDDIGCAVGEDEAGADEEAGGYRRPEFLQPIQNGRATCRDNGCPSVEISVGGES